jgi:hypothetical protein
MPGKKAPSTDLSTPTAVEKSQKVYDRIASGKTKDATAELNTAHGRTRR